MELLDAYCARIGYTGPRTATLDTLRALQQLHPAAIPFEAIDVLLDRPVLLAPQAVDAKLIHAGRGGYCFEQNSLFQRVLEALGFEVEPLIAQVRWMAGPESQHRPRTHMVLRVTVDGLPWLCDVGFGSCVLTAPIRFDLTTPQSTQHERFRLTPQGNEHLLEALLGDDWMPVYMISPAPCREGDYEMANFYSSTYPSSHFRHDLIVARSTPEARHALLRNRLTIRRTDGGGERRYLSADELEQVLAEVFLLPVTPDWRPVLERAAAAVWEPQGG
ncbi:arylamine N-acetyltransferase [Duganella sp. HH105]|uniref:arylamine N-acetyltransferase family protein n=1 Tax=Duganella sp. HH105 TaxID=1781067 RepID=UPI000877CD53|nr:arylamine N-acetyltransferase [Duganella sp. HH105]OEZ59952.1 arylamine N-acetyltransferase [Duganella sp. HH105]